jgi:cytochrome c oxidase cbb3-type subunit III
MEALATTVRGLASADVLPGPLDYETLTVDVPARIVECARVTRGRRASIGGAAIVLALAGSACDRGEPESERDEEAVAKVEARYADGALAFGQYCALCHGADATGYVADHAPSLVSPTFLASASDEYISRGIRDGRPGTAMAAYSKARGGPLDDDEVGAIVAFLRDHGPSRVPLPASAALGDVASGEAIYAETCQGCHGTRSERGTAVQLSNPALLSAASDAFLRYAVVHGRPGTPMPAFGGALRDDQIDDVVAALRSWATPLAPERRPPPPEPPLGPVVINPEGKAPTLTLREDRYVPIDEVKRALEAKNRLVIIDARATSDWLVGHIPGAIAIPYYLLSRIDALPRDGTWITAYCACPHHASGVIVDELRKRGFTHTAVLDEGILEWKRRGYPVVSDPSAAGADAGADAGAGPALGGRLPTRRVTRGAPPR